MRDPLVDKLKKLKIESWDIKILFDRLTGYTIGVTPNLYFDCIYDDKTFGSVRTCFSNLAWSIDSGRFIAYNKNDLVRHTASRDDEKIIKNAFMLPVGDAYIRTGEDFVTPDYYLYLEGDCRQLYVVGVEDSGELISAYDWRIKNKKLRKKYQRRKDHLFEDTIRIIKKYFPDSDWD